MSKGGMSVVLVAFLASFQLAQAQTFGLINGGSEFFEPVIDGWLGKCEDLGIMCYNRTVASGNMSLPCPEERVEFLRELIDLGIDGVAIKPCGTTAEEVQELYDLAEDAGIPVINFDSDIPNVTRAAYVGTDNDLMGRTLARLLRQLRPEGGRFALVGEKFDRTPWFKEEIMKYNDREGWGHWYEVPGEWSGMPEEDEGYIGLMEKYALLNPTAMVCMVQSPMREEGWRDFVDAHREQNITYIGTDASEEQLKLLGSRYVDGLVGQLPYEMGSVSAQILYDLFHHGSLPMDRYKTNVVSYNIIPLMLPELNSDENLLGNLVFFGFTCFGIIAFSAIASMAWTFRLRKAMVVKAAQPFFLSMVAVGVLIMGSTLIPLSFDDGGDPASMSEFRRVAICQSLPWLGFVGFSVTFSALLAKTWRVNRIFHARADHTRITVTERDVLGPFAALLTCNVVILTCWTIIDPLKYVRTENIGTDFWNRVVSSYGSCQSEDNTAVAYLVPLAVLNFMVVTFACIQAHRARDVKSVFSESKYIGLTVTTLFQAFCTGIPVVVVVRDMPEAFYLVLTIIIFVLCMAILLLIFLPKVLMHRNYSRMTPEELNRTVAAMVRDSSTASSKLKYDRGRSLSQGSNKLDGSNSYQISDRIDEEAEEDQGSADKLDGSNSNKISDRIDEEATEDRGSADC